MRISLMIQSCAILVKLALFGCLQGVSLDKTQHVTDNEQDSKITKTVQLEKRNSNKRYPIHGSWGKWTKITCRPTCGKGIMTSTRKCNNPKPKNNGRMCPGHYWRGYIVCNRDVIVPCPINGWTDWGEFGACSVTCGIGTKHRKRICRNGKYCEPSNFEHINKEGNIQTYECYSLAKCPVEGDWGEWGKSSTCSATCGDGKTHRIRKCRNGKYCKPGNLGGLNKEGNIQTSVCNLAECPVNGKWSEWKVISECSITCGEGTKYRSRKCNNPLPQHRGSPCKGNDLEKMKCNESACPLPSMNNWSAWSSYGECSVTCGEGIKLRTRNCTENGEEIHSTKCSGSPKDFARCLSPCLSAARTKGRKSWSVIIGASVAACAFAILVVGVAVAVYMKRKKESSQFFTILQQ